MLPHTRDAETQARFEALVDTAEVLYGVPDHSGKALARTVAANPGLRWVHTIPAGGGQQIRSAHLDAEALQRIVVLDLRRRARACRSPSSPCSACSPG